jgi:AraC-like DNA-binding protein
MTQEKQNCSNVTDSRVEELPPALLRTTVPLEVLALPNAATQAPLPPFGREACASKPAHRESARFQTLAPETESRLGAITDWPARAERAGWQVAALAGQCRVTRRELVSFFRRRFGEYSRKRLHCWRMERAARHLEEGKNVSQTADLVGFRSRTRFYYSFYEQYKMSPKKYAKLHHKKLF